MFLFTLLTCLTFINSYASRIITSILNLMPRDKTVESISSEIVQLKRELSLISIVDEFAKHARLQRKIIKLVDEKTSLVAGNAAKISSLKYTSLKIIHGITFVTLTILVYLYKGETIAELPPELLWPMPNIFNLFNGASGCISIPSWIVISFTASKIIAKNF